MPRNPAWDEESAAAVAPAESGPTPFEQLVASQMASRKPKKKGWGEALTGLIPAIAPLVVGGLVGGKQGLALGGGIASNYLNKKHEEELADAAKDQSSFDALQNALLAQMAARDKLKASQEFTAGQNKLMNEAKDYRTDKILTAKEKIAEENRKAAAARAASKPSQEEKDAKIDARDLRKEVLKTNNDIFNASSRRQIGLAKQFENGINRTEALLKSAGMHRNGKVVELRDLENMSEQEAADSLNALTPNDVAEVTKAFNSMFSQTSGAGSAEERMQLFPETYRLLASKEWQKISNDPTAAGSGAFMHRMFKTFLVEKNVTQQRLKSETLGLILPTLQKVYSDPKYIKEFGPTMRNTLKSSYIEPEDLPEDIRAAVYPNHKQATKPVNEMAEHEIDAELKKALGL